MLESLIPICTFWPVTAIYLGGMKVEVVGGGGPRQVLGLLLSFVGYLIAWRVLSALLGGIGPVVGALVLPTALALLALPAAVWVGYRLVGLSVRRAPGPAH